MSYLEKLQAEFDQITGGITAVLERAADAGRDLTDDETTQIERDDTRRDQLEKAIAHYTTLAERSSRVSGLRDKLPAAARASKAPDGTPADPAAELLRTIPTPGAYAHLLHRSVARGDREATKILERVAAEQTTGDNAGLIPAPIVGPVIDVVRKRRRFISSLGGARPAPTNKFDRPFVAQHVDLGAQAAELDELTSQKMSVTNKAVELQTLGGYLNLSKQDVRWANPGILDILFDSFGKIYARRSDALACADFLTGATQTEALDLSDLTANPITILDAWLAGALADLAEDISPDTLWMSPNIAAILRGARNAMGQKAYNIPMGNEDGEVEGLRAVIDPQFATSTLVLGNSEYVEVYEDLEGFLTVELPSVAGQQIGYTGYLDTLVADPDAFSKAAVVA